MKRDAGTAVDISAHTSPTDAHKGHNSGISIRSPIDLKNGLDPNHQLRPLAPVTTDRAFLSDAKQGRKANKCNVKPPTTVPAILTTVLSLANTPINLKIEPCAKATGDCP